LRYEQENAKEQMCIVGDERKMYQTQVDRVLTLAGKWDGSSGGGGHDRSEIFIFSGAD
jgi:hypothetical protein